MSPRATRELVALMVGATVCLVLLGSGLSLVVIELVHPETDTGAIGQTWAHAIGILFGITVGYLLGKRET